MSSFRDKVAFITGASSGIGEGLANELANQGAKLILLARRKDRLDALSLRLSSKTEVLVIVGDVTKSSDLKNAVDTGLKRYGKIDLVIASAGYGVSGAFDILSIEAFRQQFETNVFGVLETVYASLSALKASHGSLVILGSVMSYVALGGSSPYSMSKFAVRALAESLYHELKPQGVSVTLVCPGFVESEIRQIDNHGHLHAELSDPVPAWLRMPKQEAARKILKATVKRKRELRLTLHGRLGIFLKSHFPLLFHGVIDLLNVRSGKQKARL